MDAERSLARDTPSPYLPADAVMAVAGLSLRARSIADAVLAGIHRSRRHGESAEFAEHKLYAPGDEVRRIDWKAYAKLDRYFVKRFEEETALSAYLVVDCSGSMAYPERGRHSKFDYAATLAATLAYLLLRQSDAVGLLTFDKEVGAGVPLGARSSQLAEVTAVLEQTVVGGPTDVRSTFGRLRERLRRRALIVILSDLLGVVDEAGGVEEMFAGLGVLSARGADVALLQVLDPDEIELPFDGLVRFEDMELTRDLQVDAPAIRDTYREEVQSYLARVARVARASGLSYQLVRSDEPPAQALVRFAAQREGARRVRA